MQPWILCATALLLLGIAVPSASALNAPSAALAPCAEVDGGPTICADTDGAEACAANALAGGRETCYALSP